MIIERTRRTASFASFCLLVFIGGAIWQLSGDALKAAISGLLAGVLGYLFIWGFMMVGRGSDEVIQEEIIRSLKVGEEEEAASEAVEERHEAAQVSAPEPEPMMPLISEEEEAVLSAPLAPEEEESLVDTSGQEEAVIGSEEPVGEPQV